MDDFRRRDAEHGRAEIAKLRQLARRSDPRPVEIAQEYVNRREGFGIKLADRESVQMKLGTRGYSKDTIAEWVYRAVRAARLVDGADEVHKMVLAKFMRDEGRDF